MIKKYLVTGVDGFIESAERLRDLVYIDDVVEAFFKISQCNRTTILITCTGKRTTVQQLLNAIRASVATSIQSRYESSTPEDRFGIYGDPSMTKKYLDWIPTHAFEDGINQMVDWTRRKI